MDKVTRGHGDTVTGRHRDGETQGRGDAENITASPRHRVTPSPGYRVTASPYEPPAIVYESELEVRAGSPMGLPHPLTLPDLFDQP